MTLVIVVMSVVKINCDDDGDDNYIAGDGDTDRNDDGRGGNGGDGGDIGGIVVVVGGVGVGGGGFVGYGMRQQMLWEKRYFLRSDTLYNMKNGSFERF